MLDSRNYANSDRAAYSSGGTEEKLEGRLKITDSGPDSLGVELLPGNDEALPEFHQLLELLKEIMHSKTTPQT